jgi:hypothetical protein
MSEFEPSQPGLVHDSLNDVMIEWQPKWAQHYREHAIRAGHVIGWDGRLLDGWSELPKQPSQQA